VPWISVQLAIQDHLPETLDDRFQRAYQLVPQVLNAVFGLKNEGWESYRVDGKTHVRAASQRGAPTVKPTPAS